MVVAGWMLTQLGWTAALNSLMLSQADLLPEEQRGKVSGLGAFVQMVASVTGVGIASAFIGHNHLMFLVPGVIGVALMLAWVISVKEPSSLDMVLGPKLTVRRALSNMVFNPAKYPDFAWNWLGRLIFMFGVTLGTTFTTLFFASRLSTSGQVADIGGLIVILSLAGVVATGGGALLGGMLSDKFHRRRVLVLASGAGFTLGAIIMALGGTSAPILIVGSIISSLALGVFSAVNQAMVLDVLPQRDTEAGRFIGINVYSTSLAQAIAPVVAAPLLLVGMSGSDKNYTLLLLVAAACTAIGAVIVMVFVRSSK
jgi:MFS family permease